MDISLERSKNWSEFSLDPAMSHPYILRRTEISGFFDLSYRSWLLLAAVTTPPSSNIGRSLRTLPIQYFSTRLRLSVPSLALRFWRLLFTASCVLDHR